MDVQDAHNLAWKLAAVHHGLASPDLLMSYEAGVWFQSGYVCCIDVGCFFVGRV